jgi:hypothetical protein
MEHDDIRALMRNLHNLGLEKALAEHPYEYASPVYTPPTELLEPFAKVFKAVKGQLEYRRDAFEKSAVIRKEMEAALKQKKAAADLVGRERKVVLQQKLDLVHKAKEDLKQQVIKHALSVCRSVALYVFRFFLC